MPADALRPLLARLEAASEGGLSLDSALLLAFGWQDKPLVTSSLDAAVALCERLWPGRQWDVMNHHGLEGGGSAVIWPLTVGGGDRTARGATPALALCIAILRAKLEEP